MSEREKELEAACRELIAQLAETEHAWFNRYNPVSCWNLPGNNRAAIRQGEDALAMAAEK